MIRLFSCFWLAVLAGCATAETKLERFTYAEPQMGVPFQIVLYAQNKQAADAAAAAAFARIKELNDILSDYDTDSELSRLSQTGGKNLAVAVGPDLWRMLKLSQSLAHDTGGAFDITAGPVISHWRKARREKKMPNAERLQEALSAVGFHKLRLDSRRRTAELLVPYMRLDLGAIAKGYATDEALKVLQGRGISHALVSGGGDMAAGDAPPGQAGWRVRLAGFEESDSRPEYVILRNRGLATSGDLYQFVEIEGRRYSHIVDPRTGVGLIDHSVVVVIAKDATTADGLSTAISVLGPDKGLKLAEKQDACARILRKPRGTMEGMDSGCFSGFLEKEKTRPPEESGL